MFVMHAVVIAQGLNGPINGEGEDLLEQCIKTFKWIPL